MVGIRAADKERALKSIMQVECRKMFPIPALSPDPGTRVYKLPEGDLTLLLLLFFLQSFVLNLKTKTDGGQF